MGWLPVIICITSAVLLYKIQPSIFFIAAIIVALGCFWSWGIMHNFATKKAARRGTYTGGFYDITKEEAKSVPNWITTVNMLFSFFGIILLIIAVVKNLRHH